MTTEMRRKDRRLTDEETLALLKECEYGILSTTCPDGTPYGVPMSYVIEGSVIYMHCSSAGGQRLTNLAHSADTCLTVVEHVQLLPDKFATRYMSAIVCGRTTIVEDEAEKLHAMTAFLYRYCADYIETGMNYIDKAISKIKVLRLDITSISGKGRKK